MRSPNEPSQTLDESSNRESEVKKRASLSLSAMNMLAMREHSRFELEQKLSKKTEDTQLLIQVLDKLQSDNLLCDLRFTQVFIRSKANNGFGPYKIKQELKTKGVSKALIIDVLSELDINWFDIASELYQRRVARLLDIDMKEKHKQSRYLQSRGFSGDIAREVIGDLY